MHRVVLSPLKKKGMTTTTIDGGDMVCPSYISKKFSRGTYIVGGQISAAEIALRVQREENIEVVERKEFWKFIKRKGKKKADRYMDR